MTRLSSIWRARAFTLALVATTPLFLGAAKKPAKAEKKAAPAKKPAKGAPAEAKKVEASDAAKAEPAKADEKKEEGKKEEAKADEKKAPEKKGEEKKEEPKKEEAKAEEKAAPPAPPMPEPGERVIEKKASEYIARLTLRPQNLRANRPADATIDIARMLDIPDPTVGDRMPVIATRATATVKGPGMPGEKGKIGPPTETRYELTQLSQPGAYGFHFTPPTDGIFDVRFDGDDSKAESDEPKFFEINFRLGVGAQASETEQSQGAAAGRRGTRKPVGVANPDKLAMEKVQRLMEEIGFRYLDLETILGRAPAKGPHTEAAVAARELAGLMTLVKGTVPPSMSGSAAEYDKLAAQVPAMFEAVAVAAEGKDREAPKKAYAAVESAGCMQCHAKFRYEIAADVSAWPKFTLRSAK